MRLPVLAVALLLISVPAQLLAQGSASYPNKPIRIVIPAAPGGNPDVLARLLGQKLQPLLGVPMVMDNQPGAGGISAAINIAKSPPDGYVIFFGDSGIVIGVAVNPSLPFNPLKDVTLITALAGLPTVLISPPSLPASTLAEFISLAKARPGQLNYGSAGVGSIHHLTMAVFQMETGVSMVHVPYKGGSPMVAAVMAGEVQAGFSGIPNVMQAFKAGKLKVFGISTLHRSKSLPDVPTLDEQGVKGFDVATMLGVQAPAGVPRDIVARLQSAIARALREPDIAERMVSLGMELAENGTENYVQYVKNEVQRYAAAVKAAGIKPE
jgi:tripartite-type tricarboxylate transporter receptor subunit TctC